MNDYRKQIKQHQDSIMRINKQLPALREKADAALLIFEGSRVGSPVYPRADVDALSLAKTEIEEHQNALAKLEKLASWDEGVKGAAIAIGKARTMLRNAKAEVAKLQARRDTAAEKLEAIQTKRQTAIDAAEAREKSAAQTYAQAMVLGGENEQKAMDDLHAATAALEVLRRGSSASDAVAGAVTAELDELDMSIGEASRRRDSAHDSMLTAARYLWADKMERAAYELATLAAYVDATERELGWRYGSLDDFNVPLLSPEARPGYLGKLHIKDMSAGLSFDQLTAA